MPKESRECRGKKKTPNTHTHTHTHKTELYSCMMNQDNILRGVYTYYRASFPIYQKKLSHKKPELKGGRKKVFVLLSSFLSFPLLSFLLLSSSSSSSSSSFPPDSSPSSWESQPGRGTRGIGRERPGTGFY